MKLPERCPFVILDFVHTDKPVARVTEDFIEWLVRDCAKEAAMWDSEPLSGKSISEIILARYSLEPKDKP